MKCAGPSRHRARSASAVFVVAASTVAWMSACQPPRVTRAIAATLPSPWLWGGLARGPYAIGLDVLSDADSARAERLASGGTGPRPLEMVIWYPTAHSRARDTVRFATYVDLSDGSMLDIARARSDDGRRRWLAASLTPQPDGVRREVLDSILRSPMAATRGAAPPTERFPVILWSTRHATPAAQSVLSEYLASHGYVVAWMRYAGVDSLRPPFDDVPPARKAATVEAHVADMQRAIRRLVAHPSVDSTLSLIHI